MSDKVQPGGRIDRDVWERFTEWVEDKHGRTRGVTGKELEDALENHISGSNPTEPIHRIENDVATVKAQIARLEDAVVDADGGEAVTPPRPSSDVNTHTHTDDSSSQVADEFDRLESGHPSTDDQDAADGDDETVSKPGRKGSKSKKAAFVFDKMSGDGGIVVSPKAIEKIIDSEWAFGDRATSDIVDRIFAKYHAEAVNKGSAWFVAIASTPEARDAAINEWQDDPEDTKIVPESKFDGFDKAGMPKGVR